MPLNINQPKEQFLACAFHSSTVHVSILYGNPIMLYLLVQRLVTNHTLLSFLIYAHHIFHVIALLKKPPL